MSRYLKQGQAEADAFLDGCLRDTSLRAMFGDETRLPGINNIITASRALTRDSADMLLRLAKDRTKSDPEKHAAAQRVAGQLRGFLDMKAKEIRLHRNQLERDANSEARDAISLSNVRSGHDVMAADWIRSQMSRGPDGLDAIRAVMHDEPFAETLFNFRGEFLGMSGENAKTLDNMRLDIWEKRAPDSFKKLTTWAAMDGLAEKYEKAGREFNGYAYDPHMAQDAQTKVDV